MNLCVNARDAMPDRRHPHGLGAAVGNYVVLCVDDTGSGIPAALIDKIFDPFFTTKEPAKAPGSVCRRPRPSSAATAAASRCRARRIAAPASRFICRWRIAPPAPPWQAEDAPPPRGSGQTILVVDDEPSVRLVLRTALERAGYRVLPASNGREAIDVYKAQPAGAIAAMVLIDMMMPVMGGMPAIQELVKINPNVRIIAASGIPDNEATAKGAWRQVRQFLGKPFSTDKLLRAVAQVVAG